MISSIKLENIKNNLFFVTNLMFFSNLINYYLVGADLFSAKWLYSAFAITFSYVIYSLVAENYVNVKDDNYRIKKSKEDIIRYMSIYTLYQTLVVFIEEGILELSILSFSKTFITIFGYVLFDYISSDLLLKFNDHFILAVDLIKIIGVEILVLFIIYEEYNLSKGADLIGYLFSYVIWNLFTKKLIQ